MTGMEAFVMGVFFCWVMLLLADWIEGGWRR
jgi:hypothetical protein